MKKPPLILIILVFGIGVVRGSQPCDDLVKLVKSGASEAVVIAFINSSLSSYNLSSDEILQLKENGATPNEIIAAIGHKPDEEPSSNLAAGPGGDTVVSLPAVSPSDQGASSWKMHRERDAWYEQRMESMHHSLQFDAIGLLFGTFTVNYEYLFGHRNGMVIEGNYFYNGLDSYGENAELNYRLHLSRSMNSGFIGIFVKGGRTDGNENDVPGVTVGYVQRSVTVGPNIGKRWVSPRGLSVVGRIGYGYTWSKFDGAVPDQHTQNLLQERSGLDTELSIGYAF